ncbi:MAG: VanZ family protein [Planctomycetes bacterium]|nr:VanZ family protein [Planctomycetota bacterium]
MPIAVDSRVSVHDRRLRWAWLAYWVCIFALTHAPVPRNVPFIARGGDKALHFGLYFGLTILGGYALGARRAGTRSLVTWAMTYAAYAAFDEWSQRFASRTPSAQDWTADVVGILTATILLILRERGRAAVRRGSDAAKGSCAATARAVGDAPTGIDSSPAGAGGAPSRIQH